MAPIARDKTQTPPGEFKIPNKLIKRRHNKRDNRCLKSASNFVKFAKKTIKAIKDKFAMKLNVFAKPIRGDDATCNSSTLLDSKVTQFAGNAKEIYDRLMRGCDAVESGCDEANYFIERNATDSARHYATYLWNWNEQNEAQKNKKWSLYFKKFLCVTIKHMNHYDFDIIRKIITQFYSDAFPEINESTGDTCVKNVFVKKIGEYKDTAFLIADVVHSWFLISPVLMELSKYLGWDFLKEINAFILDVDTLYSVLITIIYKKHKDTSKNEHRNV